LLLSKANVVIFEKNKSYFYLAVKIFCAPLNTSLIFTNLVEAIFVGNFYFLFAWMGLEHELHAVVLALFSCRVI